MLDYFTFRELVREIGPQIEGQWVRKIYQPHALELVLHFAKDKTLIFALLPEFAHVRMDTEKPSKRLSSPFLLLARKYLEGQKVIECKMVEGQKILIISTRGGTLIAELPGIKNRLVLIDASSRILGTLPREKVETIYEPPKPPSPHLGFAPGDELKKAWLKIFAGDEKWWGLNKLHWEILREYPQNKALDLLIGLRNGKNLSAQFVSDEGVSLIPKPSVSSLNLPVLETVGEFYAKQLAETAIASKRTQYLSLIHDAEKKRKKKLEAQQQTLDEAQQSEKLKISGDLILAHLSEIKPNQDHLIVQEIEEPMRLDPNLDGSGNAQAYYKRYKRAKQAVMHLSREMEIAQQEIEALNELETWVMVSETESHLAWVAQQLARLHIAVPETSKKKLGLPANKCLSVKGPHGATYLVGRNQVENVEALRLANKEDLWFHARGIPGGHVILRAGEKKITQEMILQGAKLAAFYSKGRTWDKVPVDYTKRKEVRPIPGAQAQVTYRDHQTILVKPS